MSSIYYTYIISIIYTKYNNIPLLFNKHLPTAIIKNYNVCFDILYTFSVDMHSIYVPIDHIGKWQFSKIRCCNFNIALHITIYWVGTQHYFLFA